MKPRTIAVVGLALILIAGLAWYGWTQRSRVDESPKPAERQPDGALLLERRAGPAAAPRQKIPPRAKVERIAQVTVQPTATAPAAGAPCPPVTVDMTLIREPDGGRRVLASSPDGQVVGGIDVPVEPIVMPPSKRWAAGLSWEPARNLPGAWIERDIDLPLTARAARLGIEINQTRTDGTTGIEGRVRIGIVF